MQRHDAIDSFNLISSFCFFPPHQLEKEFKNYPKVKVRVKFTAVTFTVVPQLELNESAEK